MGSAQRFNVHRDPSKFVDEFRKDTVNVHLTELVLLHYSF